MWREQEEKKAFGIALKYRGAKYFTVTSTGEFASYVLTNSFFENLVKGVLPPKSLKNDKFGMDRYKKLDFLYRYTGQMAPMRHFLAPQLSQDRITI